MKLELTDIERAYVRGLLNTIAARTPGMGRNSKRRIAKIANKMGSLRPNLKPAERVAVFHFLSVGTTVLNRQRLDAGFDEEKIKAIDEKATLLASLITKLGVTNEEPSETDPRPATEHSGNS